MDVSFDGRYLVTGGRDCLLKVWNLQELTFLGDMKKHESDVYVRMHHPGCLFQAGKLRVLQHSRRQNYESLGCKSARLHGEFVRIASYSFGHRSAGFQIVPLTTENMASVGFDKKAVLWKIPTENQLLYKERHFSLDCIAAIDQRHFVTGSQDG